MVAPVRNDALLDLKDAGGAHVQQSSAACRQQVGALCDHEIIFGDAFEDVKFEQRIGLKQPAPEPEQRRSADKVARDVEPCRDMLGKIGFKPSYVAKCDLLGESLDNRSGHRRYDRSLDERS